MTRGYLGGSVAKINFAVFQVSDDEVDPIDLPVLLHQFLSSSPTENKVLFIQFHGAQIEFINDGLNLNLPSSVWVPERQKKKMRTTFIKVDLMMPEGRNPGILWEKLNCD